MNPLTEAEVIQRLRRHHEGFFPKTCSNCGHVFGTLREYVQSTERLWPATSYDAELHRFDVQPELQLGGMAMANCLCGSTLALSTKDMPNEQMRGLLGWAQAEMKQRGLTQHELADYLRDEIRRQVLAAPA
jgi:hypothetical protein